MFGARLTGLRCAGVATSLAGWETFRSMDETRFMTTVNPFLSSHLKSASVCAPTDPVSPASPGRKGWNAGARQLPAHMFRFSTKMPACGFDSDSQKLLRDAVKEYEFKPRGV